jgi:hypothetical protein
MVPYRLIIEAQGEGCGTIPRKGYVSVTISDEIMERIKEEMKRVNEEAGYKKFRSVAHFVEYVIMNYDAQEIEKKKGR